MCLYHASGLIITVLIKSGIRPLSEVRKLVSGSRKITFLANGDSVCIAGFKLPGVWVKFVQSLFDLDLDTRHRGHNLYTK